MCVAYIGWPIAAASISDHTSPERAGLTSAQTRDVYYLYDLRGLQTKASRTLAFA